MTISEKHLLASHVQDDRLIYQGWRTAADSHKKLGKLPIKDLQTLILKPDQTGFKGHLNLLKNLSLVRPPPVPFLFMPQDWLFFFLYCPEDFICEVMFIYEKITLINIIVKHGYISFLACLFPKLKFSISWFGLILHIWYCRKCSNPPDLKYYSEQNNGPFKCCEHTVDYISISV